MESIPSGADVYIDGKHVGETPFSGKADIDQEERVEQKKHGVIRSIAGGAFFGGLGAVIGILSMSPIDEMVEGAKSGSTYDERFCKDKETKHAVSVVKSSITFITNISGKDDFPTVSADLSAIAFRLAKEAHEAGERIKARDAFLVTASFGADESEKARTFAQAIDDAIAAEKKREDDLQRSLEAGRKLLEREDSASLTKAAGEFKKAAEIDPESKAREELEAATEKLHDTFFRKGMAHLKKQRYYRAVIAFRQALKHRDYPKTSKALRRAIRSHKESALR